MPDDRGLHVSLLAIPDAMAGTLAGMYEIFGLFEVLGTLDDAVPVRSPFHAEIIAVDDAQRAASGLPLGAHRRLEEVERTDIVILPSVLVRDGIWTRGRHAAVVDWLTSRHREGAMLCSACSGVLLLAETGLLDGREATLHWAYASTFSANYPSVRLRIGEALVAAGDRGEIVMSGASASWHDLVLYLVARTVGPTAAQAIARFMLLQWHVEGQSPFIDFQPPRDHGDRVVREQQDWLARNYAERRPVEGMVRQSGLAERTFKRRFRAATGYAPIAYVQQVRIREAKRRLERTVAPIEDIAWAVGYEDPAAFRRLFKRVTNMTPGAYRRRFSVPVLPLTASA
ncbi:MAG: helix-turn-helix domain-containing protein [Azospirillaceae bacterium]